MTTQYTLEDVVTARTQYQSSSRYYYAYYRPDLHSCGCPIWKPPEPTLEERIANSTITELMQISDPVAFPKLGKLASKEIARRLRAEYEDEP